MKSRLDVRRFFSVAWRVAIILLPWQTRFFWEGPLVNGYAWEQGRISLYASWVVMAATVILAYWLTRSAPRTFFRMKRFGWLLAGFVFLLIPSFFTVSVRATVEWWLEVVVLAGFFWSLRAMRVSLISFLRWFVISLIPHAALGIVQFFSQVIPAFKWLGLSGQNPLTLGVSVIESAGRRVLRAYGGFPHPNIFGGWLVVGLLASLCLIQKELNRRRYLFFVFASSLFVAALFFTFSRTAWLAALFGSALLFRVFHFDRPRIRSPWFFFPFALVALCMIVYWPLWYQRADGFAESAPRLERLSATERWGSLSTGMVVFENNWIVGTGPRTAALVQAVDGVRSGPPIPPHMTWLMIIDDVGVVGWAGIFYFLIFFYRRRLTRVESAFAVSLFLLALFDHYVWSFWSGLSLLFLACFVIFFDQPADLTAEP